MGDDGNRNDLGGDVASTETPIEGPIKTEDEIAAEVAKAEEEFISAPEDHVENPLVSGEPKEDDSEGDDRLRGAIGSGSLAVDYPNEKEGAAPGSGTMKRKATAKRRPRSHRSLALPWRRLRPLWPTPLQLQSRRRRSLRLA